MSKTGNYIRTEEHRKLRSEKAKKYLRDNPEVLEQKRIAYKGEHFSPKTEFKKGHIMSQATKDKMRQARLGKKWSIAVRTKMSKSAQKEGSAERRSKRWTERKTLEYRLWREAIFLRDNHTCIWCGQRGGKLQADHIKPFSLYPALRFALDNGRTLCVSCHKKTDTFGCKITTLKKQNGKSI